MCLTYHAHRGKATGAARRRRGCRGTGKFDEEANMLEDVAIIQVVPTQQGVQMMMLPYGYPFEQEFKGSISGKHFMYEYKKLPDDLETKYLEACTNLTLSTGGLAGAAGKSPLIK